MLRRYRWPIALVALVLGVTVAAPYVYINLIKEDPAPRLSLDSLPTPPTADGGTATSTSTTGPAGAGLDGTWTTTEASVVQYRVTEVLFGQDSEATGTAQGVRGTVTITGNTVTATDVEVDMTSFESDSSQRDDQFQNRIMETDQFPTATFALSEPLVLGAIPGDGREITVDVSGELTMHGVTNEVTFELTAKLTGSTFAANATIPIAFEDYEIDDPSGGPASVGDEGELELLLVFSR